MIKKILFPVAMLISAVVAAAVYYTTVSVSLNDVASVNHEIKINLNSKVPAWRRGDIIIINSEVEDGQASYTFNPINGTFALTGIVRDNGGGEGGGSDGYGGGGSIGDGDFGSGSGTNFNNDPSCFSHLPCEHTGFGGP